MSNVKQSCLFILLTGAVEIWAARESELIWSTRLEAEGKQFKHLNTYNYNCTIHLLQLQIAFNNCRNCDQLHVKICLKRSSENCGWTMVKFRVRKLFRGG